MRHRVKGKKLSRTASHRKATLQNLATSLLEHKRIRTTVAKAKETRRFVEPIITRAKEDTVQARRLIARSIKDKDVLQELFNEIAPKVAERQGGYTRIVKLGNRYGDSAEMALLELVDYGEGTAPAKPKKEKQEAKKETVTPETEEAPVKEEVKDEDVTEAEVVEETEDKKEEKTEEPKAEEKAEENEEKKEEASDEPEDKKEK